MQGLSSRRIVDRRVTRLRDGTWLTADDAVAAEEPLEIRLLWQDGGRLQRKSIAITMRTPGDDFELAAGFLFGEGIIGGLEDVADISYCLDEDEAQAFNIVNVTLTPGLRFDMSRLERNFFTTSSCGVCGKATLDALEVQGCAALADGLEIDAAVLCGLPQRLRQTQAVFEKTGGLHAAGLFDADGNLLALREDIGRHNAVDKLIGSRLLSAAPESDPPLLNAAGVGGESLILMLSGRASFELLQKALVAGIPIVAAVGAPSSLAVELAEGFNITLAGFVRANGLNLYAAPQRVRGSAR